LSIELTVPYTITAPAGVDGYGKVAVLNDTTSGNFVGYLYDLSFAREIREVFDNVTEGHGGIHGAFYSGRLPFTMEIRVERAATIALSNARADKLYAALNAQVADGSIVWTESGREATRILFRLQQGLRGPDSEGKVLVSAVSASPLILGNVATSSGPGSLTVLGEAATYPVITFTSGSSGSVVLTRSSPSPSESLALTIGGNGLAASTSTVVDFAARTVMQGSTHKRGAVVFPGSVFWAMAPGANTVSVSGASGASVSWRSAWLP
jgi:hypothetical protein